MPPADAELKLVLGSAGASPSHSTAEILNVKTSIRMHKACCTKIIGNLQSVTHSFHSWYFFATPATGAGNDVHTGDV